MLYLKRTRYYMLTYRKFDILEMIRYTCDSDFVSCLNNINSTLGYIFNHDGGVNILV